MTFGGTAVATASKLTLDDIISTKPHGERERLNFRQAAQAAMRKRKPSPMVPRLLCGTMQSKRLKIGPVVLKSRSCYATGRVWPVSGTGGAAKLAMIALGRTRLRPPRCVCPHASRQSGSWSPAAQQRWRIGVAGLSGDGPLQRYLPGRAGRFWHRSCFCNQPDAPPPMW
jgi:hypothetical protein